MAPTDKIKLMARAKKLNIANYRTLTIAELEEAIQKAQGGSGKTAQKSASENGKSAGRKTAQKTASKTAGEKSKPANAKSAPAKSAGRAPAKRQTTGGKSSSRKVTTARPAARATDGVGRMEIDNSRIDWDAEWGGGKTGNRKLIMDALRRAKGDTGKVWNKLVDKAHSMYPKTQDGKRRSKADAEKLLGWHVSRVKFDFVTQTGQHQGVVRSKSGPNAIAQKPAQGTKSAGKGRKTASTSQGGRKAATRGRGNPRKASTSRKKRRTTRR